ncbi:hypothetical protein COCOR_04038 [Corallococcus coralloides DSM 2259]|uniref:Uncharacterized protein n=1 Tax=Corallococcus coralloides (strain ATCC 25202 / DSM 2259 / NBRC 100086 / M2) TaxID=1144275 RepID=H8MVQ7_CORCM|nr:hypothetical protein [Corallococcus coralloides]AFE05588.1 hypothetical protein COCOR_04038 [Corallococcus coralloides DSM 2259]
MQDQALTEPTYILDTSAIRSLSSKLLEAGKNKGIDIASSPISFTELFRHLGGDGEKKIGFETLGQILKLRHTRILPDSYSRTVKTFAPTTDATDEVARFVESTLEMLSYATLPSGMEETQARVRGGLLEAAAGARELHQEQKASFLQMVHHIANYLSHLYSLDEIKRLPDELFIAASSGPILRSSWERTGRDGASSEAEIRTWIENSYFSTSYIISRTRDYMLKAGASASSLPIDPNDSEDAGICAHLSLTARSILVTGDLGTVRAVQEASDRLTRLLDTHSLSPGPVWTATRVRSTEEFREYLKQSELSE